MNDAQYKLALQDCLAALKLEPALTKASFRAVKCSIHMGNLEEAKNYLNNLNVSLDESKEIIGIKGYNSNKALVSKELADINILSSKVCFLDHNVSFYQLLHFISLHLPTSRLDQ